MARRVWRLVADPSDNSVLIFLAHNMLELHQSWNDACVCPGANAFAPGRAHNVLEGVAVAGGEDDP
jgi:hypothetical protein